MKNNWRWSKIACKRIKDRDREKNIIPIAMNSVVGSRGNDSGGGSGDSRNSWANKDGSEEGECGSNINVLAKHWFSTCFFIPSRLNILFSYFYYYFIHYYTYEKYFQWCNNKNLPCILLIKISNIVFINFNYNYN